MRMTDGYAGARVRVIASEIGSIAANIQEDRHINICNTQISV